MEHLWPLLLLLVTPRAQIADALAMRLAALRVRTPLGAERDVTPSAPLPRASERIGPHEEVHRAWPRAAVVARLGYGNSLHDTSPSLRWAGVLCPITMLARNVPRIRARQ